MVYLYNLTRKTEYHYQNAINTIQSFSSGCVTWKKFNLIIIQETVGHKWAKGTSVAKDETEH